MNKRSPVFRQCVITREKLLKDDLFRVIKNGKQIVLDENHNLGGHGYYVKKDIKVIEIARKKNVFAKLLHVNVDDDFYLSLIDMVKEKRD